MRATIELRRLRLSACARFRRLRAIATAAAVAKPDPARRRAAAFVAIEAANGWASFSRSYFLSCAMNARLERGIHVNPVSPISDMNVAVGMAVQTFRPKASPRSDGSWHRRDEPTWHDTYVLTTLLQRLCLKHMADVNAAFSINTRVFSDLPVFRNFFAHRNQGTSGAARSLAPQYSISVALRPADIVFARAAGRPFPVVADWIDDLSLVTEYLCY